MPRDGVLSYDPTQVPIDQVFERKWSPVPPEFWGKFRQTHTKLRAADLEFQAGCRATGKILEARVAQHKLKLRPEQIALVRDRLNVGMLGARYPVVVKNHKRDGFNIITGRLCASRVTREDWDNYEDGILMTVHDWRPEYRSGKDNRGRDEYWYDAKWTAATVCHFGGHGLARFYQRAFDATETNLLRSMWLMYDSYQRIEANFHETGEPLFSVEAAGGFWRGEICRFPIYCTSEAMQGRTSLCLHIKTFTPPTVTDDEEYE